MFIKTFENFESTYSKKINFHLENSISVVANIYRPKSKEYFALLSEIRELFDRGRIALKETDRRIFKNTDIGRFTKVKKEMIPLDLPIEDEESSNEEETRYIVYVRDSITRRIKKIKFSGKKTKNPRKDKATASYWSNRINKYIDVETCFIYSSTKKLPYTEHKIKKDVIIRHYENALRKEDFPWRRNIEDTQIEPLSDNDWMFQFDNELPQPINKKIFIPKETYYREIVGTTELNLKVMKQSLFESYKPTTKVPTLINVRKSELIKKGYIDFLDWKSNPNSLYIGRNMSIYVKGATASKWANPFPAKKYGHDECLKLYRNYILKNKQLIDSLYELEGKELGCWCHPNKCHGDILIELFKEKYY